jgi:low temperature requirement protein LtrA
VNEVEGQAAATTALHRLRRMGGRDPHEPHRVATPLELLFDLTFVVAFGVAASEFAHLLAAGHIGNALAAFLFATFAISWAWINFSWFASAYDTDDWVYRLMTMLQMVGVLVLALGIPQTFASIEHGDHLDTRVLVAGYIVMRIALVGQWLRAARQDPARRAACLTYATAVTVAQIGWLASAFAHLSAAGGLALSVLWVAIEMSGPVLAERRMGGTPWHAHHIAERYGLLAIIALGEGVVGTVATLSAAVTEEGWSVDAVLVAVAGTGLTFALWWMYFMVSFAALLHGRRELSFWFGYLHIPVFGTIVATGAGLHTAAYYIERHSELGSVGTVFSVAIPVALFLILLYAVYVLLVRRPDVAYAAFVAAGVAVVAAAVVCALAGVPMAVCLLIATFAPVVTVAGYEVIAHRRTRQRRLTSPSIG